MNDSGTCEKIDTPVTQRRSPPVHGSKVYFMRSGDTIKIGVSLDPMQRVRELQTGSAIELELLGFVNGDSRTEKKLHAKFDAIKIRREWFCAAPELLEFIKEHAYLFGPEPLTIRRKFPKREPPPPISAEARDGIVGMIHLRSRHGPNTPIGHRCSNVAEMLKNGAPAALIAKQMRDLEQLLAR